MSKFDLKKTLMNQNKQSIVTNMLGVATTTVAIPYTELEFGRYKTYEIDENEVIDLAESIATVGLEQNLVVKETEDKNKYIVVTGHKRTTAIKYIFDNNMPISANVRKSIEAPLCIVIPEDEDELITAFRMHETNVHQRKGFTISEIEDYIKIVDEAKKRKLEVNGNQIKGTTRAILKARFNISESTAKRYIKVIKEGNEELKKAIDNGNISINNAYDIIMGTAEPIIQKKEESNIDDEKIAAISENKSKENNISISKLKKSHKKVSKSLDSLINDIKEYEDNVKKLEDRKNINTKIDLIREILEELEGYIKE